MLAEASAASEELYLLEQQFRYTYDSPARRLRHRLVVIPRAVHGGQCRLDHGLSVSGGSVRMVETSDRFANHIVELQSAGIASWIEFETWALVSCNGTTGVIEVPAGSIGLGELLEPTRLTQANDVIAAAAAELLATSTGRRDLAERTCAWSHQALSYQYGVTGVHTDAVSALVGGKGVCQDYAHLMLALCRTAGLPARYVSGHLLGEGGSHAWVEVVVSDRWTDDANGATVVAFDPTHGRQAGEGYLTVAVGRDYLDVAPTSGTFEGACPGVLSARKRLRKASPDEIVHRSEVVA
jgi:transglutaminase-like putative cysteine protease